MREIDMGSFAPSVLPANSFLIHGAAKSGKTSWAGTAPRPLFLADATEHGYESLREENWNDDLTPLFEPDVRPIVWALDKESDIAEAVEKAKPLVEAKLVLSVWVDSITYFSDLVFNSILMSQAKPDTRKAYGDLGVRLRNIRIKVASLGITHGWLALTKPPSEDDPTATPMIPGQQAEKFAGGVDLVWHTRVDQPQPSKPPVFNVYTKKHLNVLAGGRLGARADQLPSPFRGTFADYLIAIGYDVDAIRASLPPIEKAREHAKRLSVEHAAKAKATPPIAAASAPSSTSSKPALVIKKVGT